MPQKVAYLLTVIAHKGRTWPQFHQTWTRYSADRLSENSQVPCHIQVNKDRWGMQPVWLVENGAWLELFVSPLFTLACLTHWFHPELTRALTQHYSFSILFTGWITLECFSLLSLLPLWQPFIQPHSFIPLTPSLLCLSYSWLLVNFCCSLISSHIFLRFFVWLSIIISSDHPLHTSDFPQLSSFLIYIYYCVKFTHSCCLTEL